MWLFIYQSQSLAKLGIDLSGTARAIYVADWGKVGPFEDRDESHLQGVTIPSAILDDPIYQVSEKLDRLFVG